MDPLCLISPEGTIRVDFEESQQAGTETPVTLWVYSPRITNQKTGEVLLDLTGGTLWDAKATFEGDDVILTLRRFPGNKPAFAARIDPALRTFVFTDKPDSPQPLSAFVDALEKRQQESDYGPKVGFARRER